MDKDGEVLKAEVKRIIKEYNFLKSERILDKFLKAILLFYPLFVVLGGILSLYFEIEWLIYFFMIAGVFIWGYAAKTAKLESDLASYLELLERIEEFDKSWREKIVIYSKKRQSEFRGFLKSRWKCYAICFIIAASLLLFPYERLISDHKFIVRKLPKGFEVIWKDGVVKVNSVLQKEKGKVLNEGREFFSWGRENEVAMIEYRHQALFGDVCYKRLIKRFEPPRVLNFMVMVKGPSYLKMEKSRERIFKNYSVSALKGATVEIKVVYSSVPKRVILLSGDGKGAGSANFYVSLTPTSREVKISFGTRKFAIGEHAFYLKALFDWGGTFEVKKVVRLKVLEDKAPQILVRRAVWDSGNLFIEGEALDDYGVDRVLLKLGRGKVIELFEGERASRVVEVKGTWECSLFTIPVLEVADLASNVSSLEIRIVYKLSNISDVKSALEKFRRELEREEMRTLQESYNLSSSKKMDIREMLKRLEKLKRQRELLLKKMKYAQKELEKYKNFMEYARVLKKIKESYKQLFSSEEINMLEKMLRQAMNSKVNAGYLKWHVHQKFKEYVQALKNYQKLLEKLAKMERLTKMSEFLKKAVEKHAPLRDKKAEESAEELAKKMREIFRNLGDSELEKRLKSALNNLRLESENYSSNRHRNSLRALNNLRSALENKLKDMKGMKNVYQACHAGLVVMFLTEGMAGSLGYAENIFRKSHLFRKNYNSAIKQKIPYFDFVVRNYYDLFVFARIFLEKLKVVMDSNPMMALRLGKLPLEFEVCTGQLYSSCQNGNLEFSRYLSWRLHEYAKNIIYILISLMNSSPSKMMMQMLMQLLKQQQQISKALSMPLPVPVRMQLSEKQQMIAQQLQKLSSLLEWYKQLQKQLQEIESQMQMLSQMLRQGNPNRKLAKAIVQRLMKSIKALEEKKSAKRKAVVYKGKEPLRKERGFGEEAVNLKKAPAEIMELWNSF